MQECDHRQFVRIWQAGPEHRKLLVHAGTGERVEVEASAKLFFQDRWSYLSDGQNSAWCNSLLKYSLHHDLNFQAEIFEKDSKAVSVCLELVWAVREGSSRE